MIVSVKFKDRVLLRSGAYPFNLEAVKSLENIDFATSVVLLTGENGSGKSTLLEAIAVGMGCNPEGGSKNFHFATTESHSALHSQLWIGKDHRTTDTFFYRAETYYNLASEMRSLDSEFSFDPKIETYYGGTTLHHLSHGQSVIQLFRHRFKPHGVYILDEPEAALSAARQLECLAAVVDLASKGAQFLIATHSPVLLAIPGAHIYELGEDGVRRANYDELESVAIFRRMLGNRENYLESLLGNT